MLRDHQRTKPLVSLDARQVLRCWNVKALDLILRLACDLPTMESMLEMLCVLSSSAW